MEHGTQAIDVRTRRGLGFTVLFWSSIASRTKGGCVLALARLKVAGNAEVDQVELTCGCAHDIAGFEVTKDDGRLTGVQIVKYGTELDADAQSFFYWQVPTFCFA